MEISIIELQGLQALSDAVLQPLTDVLPERGPRVLVDRVGGRRGEGLENFVERRDLSIRGIRRRGPAGEQLGPPTGKPRRHGGRWRRQREVGDGSC
eukprot:6545923-Alexandrium_andersonii.AAC.1